MLEAFRQARTPGRGLLALFVAGWLFAAASPCVMALESLADEPPAHDCPHCPDEVEADTGCDGTVPDGVFCDDGVDWQHERRSLDLPDVPPAVALTAPPPSLVPPDTIRPAARRDVPLPGGSPPLYLRHCSFLN